ncbi:eukaryotic translation initiation factor 5B-like isoform X4 [Sycon ciliatum]|uniref:eukaryotic translation initiation factor 5B-like isoform X4 n=1 Tax=Sycon ciliatum TaxID=27933 RepID=UPI0031F650A9
MGKGKKKKDTDWEDDVLAELEAIETGVEPPKKEAQAAAKTESEATPAAAAATATGNGAAVANGAAATANTGDGAEAEESGQKDKKKKKKKKAATSGGQSAAPRAATPDQTESASAEKDAPAAAAEASPAASASATAADGDEDGGEGGDASSSKKKKKKDKKKPEEKKKETKRKGAPGKGALALMKAALEETNRLKAEAEEEERRKEEEEEARIQALEEQKKLEKVKKDAKKEKEKQRKLRLKAEGKLLTKAEKEKKRRAEQQLEALRAQGINVPASQPRDEEAKKVKVKYGTRTRNKQKQTQKDAEEQATETTRAAEEPMQGTDTTTEGATNGDAAQSADEDLAWDEMNLDDEDGSKAAQGVPASPSAKTTKPSASSKEDAAEEESEEDDSESDSEDDEDDDDDDDSSEEESSEEESSSSEDDSLTARERAEFRIQRRNKKFKEEQAKCEEFRAPVVCVLGHVDTGKTKILDKLRHTNVQDGEAGGITQQIGATNVPLDAIVEQTKMCKEFASKFDLKLPGLLIIDTPGHESFSNLRSRGSSLCDIAVLVVDIMHGLEPQTIESLNLLKNRKTPFVVALNKIDRLFEWRRNPQSSVKNTIAKQKLNTRLEFEERSKEIIVQFAEQGLNAAVSFDNKDLRNVVSLVPTSAISGDGMGDLIALLCELSQKNLANQLAFTQQIHAQVLEVKSVPGLGMCLDVILVQGQLREGQSIVLCGMDGAFNTTIRALLMPQPMKEFRVKNAYHQEKEVKAAQGVRISGKDLEKTLAGTPLFVAYQNDEIDVLKSVQEATLKAALRSIKTEERGVYVQASTMGALEALLEFLKTSKIPYSGVSIGPVHKKDIMRSGVMLEHDAQFAVVLAFDVKVEREAQEMADSIGVKIFTADIIYHLFDAFMAFRDDYTKKKQDEFRHVAVFPCKLRTLPECVFNKRDPIVLGVIIEEGTVHVGTPLCVPTKEFVFLGTVGSIEFNHKNLDVGKKGQEVCIKIDHTSGDAPKMVGRHFEITDSIVSRISRESIDASKNYFRDQMSRTDWVLVKELKKTFGIM